MYSCTRIFFILFNSDELDIPDLSVLLSVLVSGIKFDISGIILSNCLFLLLFLMPLNATGYQGFKTILKYIFLLSNGFFLSLNIIDIIYYPFVHKRLQSDALLFLNGEKGNEIFGLIPDFIVQFWYMWLFAFGLIWILSILYNKITNAAKIDNNYYGNVYRDIGYYVLCLFAALIAIRGGTQMRPLSVINASESGESQNVPAILNSTFSMLMTMDKKALSDVRYFDENVMTDCEKGIHISEKSTLAMNKMNVVIILVESLSKQYMSYFKGTSKTPFLDSLFSKSMVFTNGFANGRESIQGIPAVIASLPALQEEPFIFSSYSTNKINSLASLLKTEGYTSSFFHGASTGTMGFHAFSKLAGFDNYYGLEDYANKEDYDGSWGIWDEQFLQFMANKLSDTQQPFVASVLTLNSHHPFELPAKYKSIFTQKGHPILSSVRYADYALSKFFETIKSQPWFSNTLFVITADHTGPNTDVLKNKLDEYRIPIAFYKPDGTLTGLSEKPANQIDIMPTVLSYLEYGKPYFAQGISLFENDCIPAAINYKMGIYQYTDSLYSYQYNGEKGIGFYNWKVDKFLKINLIHKVSYKKDIAQKNNALKKIIQTFNQTMIHNKMTIK
ncbi:MAG: LTA synthase family protein [Saprospiraceae bacterium]|nr:LTA synthase family protein [Saprospiraceae bacterium]